MRSKELKAVYRPSDNPLYFIYSALTSTHRIKKLSFLVAAFAVIANVAKLTYARTDILSFSFFRAQKTNTSLKAARYDRWSVAQFVESSRNTEQQFQVTKNK